MEVFRQSRRTGREARATGDTRYGADIVNRTGRAADRRLTESVAPRLHIAGPGDAVAARAEAEPERPLPRRQASLDDASAALRARKDLAKTGTEQATHRQRA